jgi:hypothetical protein
MKFSTGRTGAVELITNGTGLEFINSHMVELAAGTAGILSSYLYSFTA